MHTTGDISNFYLQSGINIQNSLNSAIFLQEPEENSIYPTLDPTKNKNLKVYVYISCKFGWTDAGNLANLIKGALADIYEEHFPECKNKLKKADLNRIAQILRDSYMDDTSIEVTLHNLMEELLKPTFSHEDIPSWCCLRSDCCSTEHCCSREDCCKTNFDDLNLIQQGEYLSISQAMKMIQVLDLTSMQIKTFISSSTRVQTLLNLDKTLKSKEIAHQDLRPDHLSLSKEILANRKETQPWGNTEPDDFPIISEEVYPYLGLMYNRTTDRVSLRSKQIYLKAIMK